jgi:hypothetical protein
MCAADPRFALRYHLLDPAARRFQSPLDWGRISVFGFGLAALRWIADCQSARRAEDPRSGAEN